MGSSGTKRDFENQILSSIHSTTELKSRMKERTIEDTVETYLLQLAKYPIIASQINGYFPVSVDKTANSNGRLTFSFFNIPFIYTLLLCIILPLLLFKMSEVSSSLVANVTQGVVADSITLKVLTTLYICNPFVHRVLGLAISKRILNLWKKNCNLLENFFLDQFSLNILTKELSKINSTSRVTFFGTLGLSLLGTLAFTYLTNVLIALGLEEATKQNSFLMEKDISINLVFTILPFYAFIHPLSVYLIILFPNLYCLCLHIIADKLKSLSLNSEPMKELFRIRVSIGSSLSNEKSKISSDDDEVIIQASEMYENTSQLIKEYNSHFGIRLVGEMIYNMLLTLGFTYLMIVWVSEGQYSSSLSVIFPVIMSVGQMYTLGSVGSRLKQKSTEVMDALQDLNPENMSPKVQWKVKMLISRISMHPLQITPGNYFVLNKSCLVSVLSFIISSLIVLAQLRSK